MAVGHLWPEGAAWIGAYLAIIAVIWALKLWRRAVVRRVVYLLSFALLWQLAYLSGHFSPIIFPSVPTIAKDLFHELANGTMFQKAGYSLYLILVGMALSIAVALVLTALSMLSRTVKDLSKTLITILDPLPGVALLPLAILWVGIGEKAIVFIIIHSVVWPILLNVITGFDSVPVIYQDVGRSFGLKRLKLVALIYAPASFPSILTGIKTGWSRAWRALISAEMVFGATGVVGGLGWDIYMKRSYLDMPGMFASLIVIMIIGILVEVTLFSNVERVTLRRWGVTQ